MVQSRVGLAFLFCNLIFAAQSELVDVKKFDFSLKLDIELAKKNVKTGERVYEEARCLLRKPVVEALSRVQTQLKLQNHELLIKDCYRSLTTQRKYAHRLKESNHSRGTALDVILIDKIGAVAGPKEQVLLVKAMEGESFIQAKKNSKHFEFMSSQEFSELDLSLSDVP